jgi:ubiquinone/menaquinone biosynthesis C-methylase UbiE
MADRYTHGHHESVLRSHRWRTAGNSAGYLLPHLAPGQRLLDIGCGPGTITLDLARRVAPGAVVGIDVAPDAIDAAITARVQAGLGEDAVALSLGDVYALDAPDGSFDVVHAHQVLQHLTDPVTALREMHRVLAPGGVVAVRESDYGAFTWAPADPVLDRWLELYHQVTAANHADADAGRHLPGWFRAAGFTDVTVASSTWTFATPEDRAWWGGLWADRVVSSDFARQALEYGLSEQTELEAISAAFRRWAADPDGVFLLVHVEVLARG